MKDDVVQRLLEGIRKYGLENVSTLSKWIDIPVETARYMIWEELPKHNIDVGVSVNLPMIGLNRWLLEIKPSRKSYATVLEESIKKSNCGLLYISRVLPENSLFTFIAIPFGEEQKIRDELEHLKLEEIIESYSLQELEWMRHLSFNPEFYDFKQRTWNFEWSEVEGNREPLLTPYSRADINETPSIDYKDVLILKELRQRVPRTLSKLSSSLVLDQHNLRYHYKNHARRAIQGYFLRLIGENANGFNASFKFTYEPPGEKSLLQARKVALSLPFTTHVWKAERVFGWSGNCPGEYVNGVLRYVNDKFEEIPGAVRLIMIDAQTEYSAPLPYRLFDERSESWKYEPNLGLEVLEKK